MKYCLFSLSVFCSSSLESFFINEFELDRSNAAVFNGAANAVAVVDVVVGIPELFHFEEPLVVIAKVAVKRRDRTPSIMRE